MSATDYLENYKMDHEKRGYVVIINNKEIIIPIDIAILWVANKYFP
jgi:hypothetical protein